MKKFFKWLRIIAAAIFLIIVISIISLVIGENRYEKEKNAKMRKEKTITTKKEKITLSEDTKLFVNLKIEDSYFGYNIVGASNFPDSTQLSFFTNNFDDNQHSQNKAVVMGGGFIASFGNSFLESDELVITCYNNRFWQSNNILEQLGYLITPRDDEENIEIKLKIKTIKTEYLNKTLNIDTIYSPVGFVESEKRVDFFNVYRLAVNIIVPKSFDEKNAEKELRYQLGQVLLKHSNMDAVIIRMFRKSDDICIKSLKFTPNGDWSNPAKDRPFSKYIVDVN